MISASVGSLFRTGCNGQDQGLQLLKELRLGEATICYWEGIIKEKSDHELTEPTRDRLGSLRKQVEEYISSVTKLVGSNEIIEAAKSQSGYGTTQGKQPAKKKRTSPTN